MHRRKLHAELRGAYMPPRSGLRPVVFTAKEAFVKLRVVCVFSGALLSLGCGPEAPSVRYSGTTLAAHKPTDVKVYRGSMPDRPYQELGTVDVSCPTAAQQGGFGSIHVEGGCTYETALQMATDQAAQAGADGIFNIQTSASGNGSLVSLTAVAVRFTGAPPAAPAAAKPTPEARLKRLQELLRQGLISEDDYAKRKAEILGEL
jgi:hypothetical protein